MLRSAALAVLAIALSSSVAAAQQVADPDTEILFAIGVDLTPPPPMEAGDVDILTAIGFEIELAPPLIESSDLIVLAEFAQPAPMESSVDQPLSSSATQRFAARTEALYTLGVDRAQLLMEKTRLGVSYLQQNPQHAQYALHVGLQLLDVVTTTKALNAGHQEGNPMLQNNTAPKLIIGKVAAVGLQMYALERLAKTKPRAARWIIIATNAAMSLVVANNLAVMNR